MGKFGSIKVNNSALDGVKLIGDKTAVLTFTQDHLTDNYLLWLNDTEVTRYSNQRFMQHSRESLNKFFQSFTDSPNMFLAILDRMTGEYIGTMTVYFSLPHNTADIGIMIGERSAWGKGIGVEAWTIVMKYLFEYRGVRKVTGGTVRANQGMVKIFEKSGMSLEATRLRHQIFDKEEHDILLYAKFA